MVKVAVNCQPAIHMNILFQNHINTENLVQHFVAPAAGANRNVETRHSKIAHVGIMILVLTAAACAIFEWRVSTLWLASAAGATKCRPASTRAGTSPQHKVAE